MNERLKQLALEAEDYAFDEANKLIDSSETVFHNRVFFKSFKEKFAELIVGECINTLYQHGWTDAANDMKEHFGVEE